MKKSTSSVVPQDMLRRRTAIHLLIMASVSLLTVIYNLVTMHFEHWLEDIDYVTPTSFALFSFLTGAALVKWVARTNRMINVIGTVALLLGCAAVAELTSLTPPELRPELTLIFIYALILMSRSAIVPERPVVTITLAVVLLLPLLKITYYVHRDFVPPDGLVWPPIPALLGYLSFLWLLVSFTAYAMSRVIYGLRREAHRAEQLGQYTLEERLGGGGMGNVYRARHGLLQRPTAVKLIRFEEPSQREALLKRFEHEVKLTAQLTHPNTITVYDYGQTDDGVFYYAMELLEGASLEEIVKLGGPMDPARALAAFRQAAAALSEAHSHGFIHRDIKPGNIMLAKIGGEHDFVKVLDFGLVKDTGSHGDVGTTQAGTLVGTPQYMAPEASAGLEQDARADVYALGAVAYFLLSGKPVFGGNTPIEVLGHHLHSPPPPLKDRVRQPIPAALENLIMRCLEKQPDDRPADAGELHRVLNEISIEPDWTARAAKEWWEEYAPALGELRTESKHSTTSLTMIRRAG